MQSEGTFMDTMLSLLNYAQVFKKDYGVRFVDLKTMDIVEDVLPSNALTVNCNASYILYIRVSRTMIKYQNVLPLLIKPEKNAPAARTLHITYLDDPSFCTSSEKDIPS